MGSLQVLEETYRDQGLKVLGFYSNDFSGQGGTPGEIEACTDDYGITFLQFYLAPVTGPQARPVFQWIAAQPNPGPKQGDIAPTWNFHKWLIARDGTLVSAFAQASDPGTDPNSAQWQNHEMVVAIEAEL